MLYNYLYNLQLIISNYWLLQCCKMMLHGSSLHNQFLRQQPHSSSSSMNSVMFLVLPLSATWSTEAQLRVVFWSQKSSKSFRSFFDARHCNWLGMDYRFKSTNYLDWFTVAWGLMWQLQNCAWKLFFSVFHPRFQPPTTGLVFSS